MSDVVTMSDYAEFDRLLSGYFEGTLGADELAKLQAKLLADDEFAEHVSRWCLMHRQITEVLAEGAMHEMMEQFAQGSPGLRKKAFGRREAASNKGSDSAWGDGGASESSAARHSGGRRFFMAATLGISATLMLALGAAVWEFGWRGNSDDSARQAQSEASAANRDLGNIATLTQVSDEVWEPGATVLRHGQLLGTGSRVALRSGMAKVTFDCGAEVVLQGPCDFIVRSRMVGYLKSGRLTADVPRRAFTFAILSPEVDFVDLGTSFGVNVGSNGRTALHVFQGEVLCSQTANGEQIQNSEVIHVTTDKAVEFNNQGGEPADVAMDKNQFSRLIALRRAADQAQPQGLPEHLALWLAADVAVTTDATHRVISWQDIVYGDNRSGEDAVQDIEAARPALIPDALNGHPAIRFDGSSDYLLTTPLETTDDQTVMFVCQFTPNAYDKDRVWGGQILNYDGPPSRYLSDTLQPGVLQIGEPLLAKEFKPTLLTGQVFAGFIGSATVEAGRVDAEQVSDNVPVVVAYLYDYEHGKASLLINGRSYGEARAFAPQGITSRKIIGRHAWMENFFHGDLAELLIFNKALAPQELKDTTAYLAGKYSITLDSQSQRNEEVQQ